MTDSRSETSDTTNPGQHVYVVGIGASAGGLDALTRLFEHAPRQTHMAFVVVQHLSPNHESLMADLLATHTQLRVRRAEDGMPLEPETVYVIEPSTDLRVKDHSLQIRRVDTRTHKPIDVLFNSMAEAYGSECAVVVLSGTGSDGTLGIEAVRAAGGLCIAQDPDTATFDGMPRAAIERGGVDLVLAPEQMVHALTEMRSLAHDVTAGADDHDGTGDRDEAASLLRILQVIRATTGIDFSYYKESTLTRRIRKRLQQQGLPSLAAYASLLATNRSETTLLSNDLLIGVTQFFRDVEAFHVLRSVVLPRVISRPGTDPIRVWIGGCSTGEEAYSVAMLLDEALQQIGSTRGFRLFATDLDENAIQTAGRGEYPESALETVPRERRERYFSTSPGGWTISKALREQLLFSVHNIITDPPFSRLDLVVCRNLLIYLKAPIQTRVIKVLTNGLRQDGILWLGPSETLGPVAADYVDIDARAGFYAVKANRLRSHVLPILRSHRSREVRNPSRGSTSGNEPPVPVLRRFLPTTLILDRDLNVLFRFGRPARFLNMPEGRASFDVRGMLPDRMAAVVSTAARKALTVSEEVFYKDVSDTFDGTSHTVNVRALGFAEGGEQRIAIVLEEIVSTSTTVPVSKLEADSQSQVRVLEEELRHTRETLQSTVEELESSNEELQATNEELVASNEELQSVNEELQSVNEELHTVNIEYAEKLEQLGAFNDELDVLLAHVEAGVLFLGEHLDVRRFNERASAYIHLLDQDIGRPLAHLTHRLEYPSFLDDCAQVLRTSTSLRTVVEQREGSQPTHVQVDLRPIVGPKVQSRGVVVTLTQATLTTAHPTRLKELVDLLDARGLPAIVVDKNLRIVLGGDRFWSCTGRDTRHAAELTLSDILDTSSADLAEVFRAHLTSQGTLTAVGLISTPAGDVIPTRLSALAQGNEGDNPFSLVTLDFGNITTPGPAGSQLLAVERQTGTLMWSHDRTGELPKTWHRLLELQPETIRKQLQDGEPIEASAVCVIAGTSFDMRGTGRATAAQGQVWDFFVLAPVARS